MIVFPESPGLGGKCPLSIFTRGRLVALIRYTHTSPQGAFLGGGPSADISAI
jgi:hypothetical protein